MGCEDAGQRKGVATALRKTRSATFFSEKRFSPNNTVLYDGRVSVILGN